MIDRGADRRQADRDVHTGLDAEHLDRAVPLIVIHGDHEVEVAAAGAEKQGVGRQRSFDVLAFRGARGDRRSDLLRFLAAAEQAVFAGVRVDRANADFRVGDAGALQGVVAAGDGPFDEGRVDAFYGFDQSAVRGDVDHPQFRRDQHHRYLRRAGQVGEHLGMTVEWVSAGVQRLLVERGGADRVGSVGED